MGLLLNQALRADGKEGGVNQQGTKEGDDGIAWVRRTTERVLDGRLGMLLPCVFLINREEPLCLRSLLGTADQFLNQSI